MSSHTPRNETRLRSLIEKHQLGEVSDLLLKSAVDCVQLLLGEEGVAPTPGVSRVGGVPDLPSPESWPVANDRLLNFLMQINLADVPRFADNPLPEQGLLSFFLEDDEHCRKIRCRLQFVADASSVRPASPPPEERLARPEYGGLAAHRLVLAAAIDLPGQGSPLYEQVKQRATRTSQGAARDRFLRLVEECSLEEGSADCIGQLLGVAEAVSGDLRVHAHLTSTDQFEQMYDPEYLESNREELIRKAEQWRLLWRIDSCDDVGLRIWENGSIHILIRAADLAKRNFDRGYAEIVAG